MRKIIVIGCPGSGKTTFAEKLQRATNLAPISFPFNYGFVPFT